MYINHVNSMINIIDMVGQIILKFDGIGNQNARHYNN